MAFYPTWQTDPSQSWQNQFIQQIPQNTPAITSLNSIDFQPQVSWYHTIKTSSAKTIFLPLSELHIPTQQLRSNWNWFRSKLWSNVWRSGPTLWFPNTADHTDQPSLSTKCQLRSDRYLRRPSINGSSSTSCFTKFPTTTAAKWTLEDGVGKRHAWISASEQRTAALTQL